MDTEELLKNHLKQVRTIKSKLPCVLNVKNYIIPQSVEEMKAVGPLSPHLEIDNRWFFFKENSQKALIDIVEMISSLQIVHGNNSYSNVYKEVMACIEKWLPDGKCEPFEFIDTCLSSLLKKQCRYVYYSVIEGVKLENIKSIELGVMQVCGFECCIKEISENNSSSNPDSTSVINNFIRKNFQGKMVVRGEVFGDQEKSKEKFIENCKLVVSVLRLIASTIYVQGYSRDNVSINLPHDRSGGSVHYLATERNRQNIIWGWSSTEPEEMPINKEIIDTLQEDYFFDDLISFIWNQEISEIEGSIITAIHWIGEGQNERNLDNAFIMYWTAIEAVFSSGEKRISENIAKGLSTLLAFGGYRIISLEEKEITYAKIKKLYSKRSKVVHRGIRKQVSKKEIIEISKYSKWVVFTLLGLRKKGYQTLEQLKKETDRLHNIVNKRGQRGA